MPAYKCPCYSPAVVAVLFAMVLALPAQQGSSARADKTVNAQNQSSELRTEKFNVKQEFGPQSVGRRGDRMTTATPPGQNNSHSGSSGSTSEFRQEFGPQSVSRRGDRMTAAAPPANSGSKLQTPTPAAIAPGGKRTNSPATPNSAQKPQ